MPIYVYKCSAGHEFELRQSFSASAEAECPTCSGQARRKIHSPAVIYKGNGFYTTDYARKNLVPAGESKNGSQETPAPSPAGSGDGHGHDHGHDHGHAHEPAGGVVTPAS
ncbi:MAG: hypothetical protein HY681_04255 [Chloroflexi bacterium]|nr:hypothetical protein [Chloroflexota bacterium]